MALPTKNHPHNSHNQNHAHDNNSEEKDKRKLAIISSNPDPKNLPQIVKCHVDLGSTSYHAGCNGQHHRHSGIPRNSSKPSSSGAPKRGDLIPYQQNHDIKKTNKTAPSLLAPEQSKKQHQQQNASPPPSNKMRLIKRKTILINPIPSTIPQPIQSMINNNDQQCTNSVEDCSNSPDVQLISENMNSFERQLSCKSMQCCTMPSEVKVVTESNTIGQQCTKSIICCSGVSRSKLDNPDCRINLLKDKILGRIFGYLNHSDVLQCRAVQKRWNDLISTADSFLESTVYVVNIQKLYNVQMDILSYNNDSLTFAQLPFRHARFQYFDHHYFKEPKAFSFRNSDNQRYFPKSSFLKNLKSVEFISSYLLWQTLKRILANTLMLESLSISNCYLSEVPISTYSITEFEEFTVGKVVTEIRRLEINEMKDLNNITKLVKKFLGYYNRNLNSLKITYYPPRGTKDSFDDHSKVACVDFCRELKTLISLNATKLQTLILHLHHGPTLDLLGGHLGKELEALGQSELDLEEFQLSPALGCWMHHPDKAPESNVAMTMKNVKNSQKLIKAVTKAFAKFLDSQTNLKRLGLPCIEYPEAYTGDFTSVLNRLPCTENLEELIVPCPGLLPENFLHRFPKLRKVKLGGSCCGDISPCWDIFKGYVDKNENVPTASNLSQWKLALINTQVKITSKTHPAPSSSGVLKSEVSQENLDKMKQIEELSIASIENARNFSKLAQRLTNLITLEVKSDFDGPVFSDNDLQACIQHLTRLRNLIIDHSENFTDFGVTGIPNKFCQMMFKHQKYPLEGVNTKIWGSEKVTGRPLSDLKGLRKLILMGTCQVTDIGIGYGLDFQELVYCHLPYSHYITSWGIARVGSMNPSVESIVLSGVNQDTKDAFKKLKSTHQRLRKGDVTRSKYYREHESKFQDDFTLILPTPQQVFAGLVSFFAKQIHAILFLFKNVEEPMPQAIDVNDK